jgi:hypothetical protein
VVSGEILTEGSGLWDFLQFFQGDKELRKPRPVLPEEAA